MEIIKDKYGIDCFKIKVNQIDDFDKQWGINTVEYLASDYGNEYYLLRNNGVFGCIVRKEDCTVV
jgi:hypothetical protein